MIGSNNTFHRSLSTWVPFHCQVPLPKRELERYKQTHITTSEEESVNGYCLYNSCCTLMSFSLYRKYVTLMQSTRVWTEDEWFRSMKENCHIYAILYKEGPDGIWNGDFDETFEENCRALWNLPFSKDLLLEAIQFACKSCYESVRFCNFVCVWLERQFHAMSSKADDENCDGTDEVVVEEDGFYCESPKQYPPQYLWKDGEDGTSKQFARGLKARALGRIRPIRNTYTQSLLVVFECPSIKYTNNKSQTTSQDRLEPVAVIEEVD